MVPTSSTSGKPVPACADVRRAAKGFKRSRPAHRACRDGLDELDQREPVPAFAAYDEPPKDSSGTGPAHRACRDGLDELDQREAGPSVRGVRQPPKGSTGADPAHRACRDGLDKLDQREAGPSVCGGTTSHQRIQAEPTRSSSLSRWSRHSSTSGKPVPACADVTTSHQRAPRADPAHRACRDGLDKLDQRQAGPSVADVRRATKGSTGADPLIEPVEMVPTSSTSGKPVQRARTYDEPPKGSSGAHRSSSLSRWSRPARRKPVPACADVRRAAKGFKRSRPRSSSLSRWSRRARPAASRSQRSRT